MKKFYIHEHDRVVEILCDGIEAFYDPLYGVVETERGKCYTVGRSAWKTHQEALDVLLQSAAAEYNSALNRLRGVEEFRAQDILNTIGKEAS